MHLNFLPCKMGMMNRTLTVTGRVTMLAVAGEKLKMGS